MIQQSAHPFIGSRRGRCRLGCDQYCRSKHSRHRFRPERFASSLRFQPAHHRTLSAASWLEGTDRESEGWRVIVENRPGGVTTIAATDVLTPAGGRPQLYAMSVPSVAAPSLVPNISFNLDKDFEPVIKATVSYNVLVVNPSVPAKTVAELVALLKSQPDKLTFSSGGFGTPAHLIGEQFKLQTGTRAQHVPYAQFPQAIGDLLNGTNAFMFITMLPVVDLIKTGKLRALAVTGPKRVPILPDVPTIVEAGYPSLVVEDWTGFAVKRGTPKETVARLNAPINKALREVVGPEALAKIGAEPAGGTPEEFGRLVGDQVAHWKKVVAEADMKVQPVVTGFRVTLLGTGVPIPRPDRFGPSTLIEAGDQTLLIDAGRGATMRLFQLGVPIGQIDALLLTHFHSDHTVGIPDLWLTGWLSSYFGNRQRAVQRDRPHRDQRR